MLRLIKKIKNNIEWKEYCRRDRYRCLRDKTRTKEEEKEYKKLCRRYD